MSESSNNPAVRSILTGTIDAVVGVIDFGIDSSGKKSAMWRIYYDSEIGSPVEKAAQKAVAVAIYKSLVNYFPSLESDSKTVVAVTRTVLSMLDRSKLLYQFRHGRINETRYFDELTKRYASTLVVIIRRGEQYLSDTLPSLLERNLGIPRTVTEKALDFVFSKITLSEEQSRKIVSEGLRKVNHLVKELDERITKTLEPVIVFVKEKLIDKGKKVVKEVEETVKRFLKR